MESLTSLQGCSWCILQPQPSEQRKLKKAEEHVGDDYPNCNWSTWNGRQRLGEKTGGIGN